MSDINILLMETHIREIEEYTQALEQNIKDFNSKDNIPIQQIDAKLIQKELNKVKSQIGAYNENTRSNNR
jgi:hypothetical protein